MEKVILNFVSYTGQISIAVRFSPGLEYTLWVPYATPEFKIWDMCMVILVAYPHPVGFATYDSIGNYVRDRWSVHCARLAR